MASLLGANTPFDESGSVTGKKRQAVDDKLAKSRERNRMHARKTRERKKNQMTALQQRIEDLHVQSKQLRLQVDERYTARLLIGLSQSDTCEGEVAVKSSSMLCSDSYSNSTDWFREETQIPFQKRVRSPGKYTQLERETFRRERNRMHAKRTRDRKKMFFEISEKVITSMEQENKVLRDYLVSINVMEAEDAVMCEEHDRAARSSLVALRSGMEEQADGPASDDEEEDEEDEDAEKDSNNDSVMGSNDDNSNGSTSHESASSSSATCTPPGLDEIENETYIGTSDGEDVSYDVTEANMSFQVQDKNSANFINKTTLEALNAWIAVPGAVDRAVHR